MIDLLGVIRKIGRPASSRPEPAPGAAVVTPQTGASGRHPVPVPEACAPGAEKSPDAKDDGCDPYNSGMFDRRDSWSRVNKRS